MIDVGGGCCSCGSEPGLKVGEARGWVFRLYPLAHPNVSVFSVSAFTPAV